MRSLDQVALALGRLRPDLPCEIQEARHPMFGRVIRLTINVGEFLDFSMVGQQLTCMNWGLNGDAIERSSVHLVEDITSKSDAEVAELIYELSLSFSKVVKSDELQLVAKLMANEGGSTPGAPTRELRYPNLVGVIGALVLGLALVALSGMGALVPEQPTNPISGDFEVQTVEEDEIIILPTIAPNPGSGYVVICNDGWISHSGGRQGACSHHGGVAD